jgi:hypothetical protein
MVSTVLTALGGLSSVLYLLEYAGIRMSSLILPTNTVYLAIAILGGALCFSYLLYELVRALRVHTQVLMGEIYGEKENKFLVGGTICFKARYRGILKGGYFTVKVRPPERHAIADTGRDHEWLVDYNTNDGTSSTGRGMLNGQGSGWPRKSHTSSWGHKIPFAYPAGKYTATLMVRDSTSSEPLKEVPLSFTILGEELIPLVGFTTQKTVIPNRSMFVRKPRARSWLGTLR